MTAGVCRLFAVLAAVAPFACATVQIQPPARTTLPVAGGPGLDVNVGAIILSEDMLVDEADAESRVVFSIELDNRDVVSARVDPNAIRLIVRTPGAPDTALPPTSSGWGQPPATDPATRALPADLGPHEQRRAWVAFPVPTSLRTAPAPPSRLLLAIEVEGAVSEVLVAGPDGPRWLQYPAGPMHQAITGAVFLAPDTVADVLGLRIDLGSLAHVTLGPLVARRAGQLALGVAVGFQIDVPVTLRVSNHIRLTPGFSLEIAAGRNSYPGRYPNAEVGLVGATAGIEVAFGTLRPPNAAHLPLQYAWPLAPLSLRFAYVRWWSLRADDDFGTAGRSGLAAALTVRFGP